MTERAPALQQATGVAQRSISIPDWSVLCTSAGCGAQARVASTPCHIIGGFIHIDYVQVHLPSDCGKAIIAVMETKWLEDFVSLAETRSFSRSAQLRHVTQPAFSRRIQALEAWAGTDLVDRSSYPTRLTLRARPCMSRRWRCCRHCKAPAPCCVPMPVVTRAWWALLCPIPWPSHFPCLGVAGAGAVRAVQSRLIALNVHDAVMRLVEGGCDFLIAYHHSSQPLQLDPARYEMVRLGEELLAPYAKPDADGNPLFTLPGTATQSLPFLAYGPGAYLGRLTELLLAEADMPRHLSVSMKPIWLKV